MSDPKSAKDIAKGGSDCLGRDVGAELILNGGNDCSTGHALKSPYVSIPYT